MPETPAVVITGVGPVTAIGTGGEAYWQALLAGRRGVGLLDRRTDGGPKPPPNWRSSRYPGIWLGAPIVDFQGAQFVRPRKAMKVMGRDLQTAFAAARLAIDAAAIEPAINQGTLAKDRIATVFGSQMLYGTHDEVAEAIRHADDGSGICSPGRFGAAAMREIMPLWMLKYLPNMPACHVGISIGATGANNTIVCGDVSVTSALIESVGVLRRGIADVVICGGAGTLIDGTRMIYRGTGPFPSPADPLDRSSRPHTCQADGVAGGEAAGALVLELGEAASARGVTPLAAVVASASRFGSSRNGRCGVTDGLVAAIRAALEQADLAPAAIGLIVSHGTGDPPRDAAERRAIEATVPAAPLVMPLAAVGHSGAAVGAVHLITATLTLHHRTVPPSYLHGTAINGWEDRFSDSPRPLQGEAVLVLTHTPQGIANAVILAAP